MRRAPTLGLKLQVLVRSPGWHPEWMGPKPSVPATREEQKKYDVAPGRSVIAYALAWFSLATVATFFLSMWGATLSFPRALASACLVCLTLLCVAGLLEQKRWVKFVEPLRWAALAALVPLWGAS
jgi:hypothetical protein